MSYSQSIRPGVVIRSVNMRRTVLALVAAVFAVLLGSSATFASADNTHFNFMAPNISGASGAVFMTGGGTFNATSGVIHTDGGFRCTSTVSGGPLAGCLARQGGHWEAANALRSTPFKCTATDPAGVKTATISPDTAVLRANFFQDGEGHQVSFTANVIVSTNDIAPDVPGIQNAWIQGVGCGSARVHFSR